MPRILSFLSVDIFIFPNADTNSSHVLGIYRESNVPVMHRIGWTEEKI